MMALRQGVCIASSNLWDGGEKKKGLVVFALMKCSKTAFDYLPREKKVGQTHSLLDK